MPNPIIQIAKENWDTGDAHACATEWFFQMCRLWSEHASPATGTCPVDYRDPSGPTDFAGSLDTGEDSEYWDAVMALLSDQGLLEIPWTDESMMRLALEWEDGAPDGYSPAQAFAHIRTALHTFHRIYRLTLSDDES